MMPSQTGTTLAAHESERDRRPLTAAKRAWIHRTARIHIDPGHPTHVERTAQYLVPQRDQCVDCHDQSDDGERILMPIGPNSRTLNADVLVTLTDTAAPSGATTQVAWEALEAAGVDSLSADEVIIAARDNLDINCAHCHNSQGIDDARHRTEPDPRC